MHSAAVVYCRVMLKIANTLLALLGVAVMVYAVYMYGEVHRRPGPTPAAPPPPTHHSPPPPSHHHHHSPPPPSHHHHSPPPPPSPDVPPPADLLLALAAGAAGIAAQHAAMPW